MGSLLDDTGLQNGQPGRAILNCQLAHQLCAEDGSCTSMLTVIRHICGPETGKTALFCLSKNCVKILMCLVAGSIDRA